MTPRRMKLFVHARRFLFFWITFSSVSLFADSTPCARVAITVGTVTNDAKVRLEPGSLITQGTTVRTGPSSLAKFLLNDDSLLDLGPSTTFRFTHCEGKTETPSIDLELMLGNVRASVSKKSPGQREKFQIRTRSSVLAVRGTELFASWQLNRQGQIEEQVGVTEGQVQVTSLITPGSPSFQISGGQHFQTQFSFQGSPDKSPLVPLSPSRVDQFTAREQKDFENNVKIEDPIFVDSVTLPDRPKAGPPKGQETSEVIFEAVTGEKRRPDKRPDFSKGPASQRPPGDQPLDPNQKPPILPDANQTETPPTLAPPGGTGDFVPGTSGTAPPPPGSSTGTGTGTFDPGINALPIIVDIIFHK
jgi:hypothetical protein